MLVIKSVLFILEVIQVPFLFLFVILSRVLPKKIDVGIGPDPLINNIFHKKALVQFGYSAETFCLKPYYITNDFDYIFGSQSLINRIYQCLFRPVFIFSCLRYRSLLIYFNGGPLYPYSVFLWKLEPLLLKVAGIPVVVLAYGGDVQDLLRTPNLYFRHTVMQDYPRHKTRTLLIRKKIELWTQHASHIVGGCDWVDYLYHWDSLMISHFAIDTAAIENTPKSSADKKSFSVLHAPNHRQIKGTQHIIDAVQSLKNKGYDIELTLIEKCSNQEVLEKISQADLIVDQLVIGWYAMFAIEAMSRGKPVICYLREDLIRLYENANLLNRNEIPLINSDCARIEETLESLLLNREILKLKGEDGVDYVTKHHSLEFIGKSFREILKSLNILPSQKNHE